MHMLLYNNLQDHKFGIFYINLLTNIFFDILVHSI